MSASSNWSYTATATHWVCMGYDGLTGGTSYAAPVTFQCDYSAEAKRMTDAKGVEYVSRQTIYTERSTIKPGDYVAIGAFTEANPVSAGALEVRDVLRYADTFERTADDYKVVT